MDLSGAVYDRMAQDSTLVAMLASADAIFLDDRVGPDVPLPYIVSAGNVADEPNDSKTDRGRRPTRDIYCYARHGSTALVEQMAERVLELFHRHRLTLEDGWYAYGATGHGPVAISSDDYDARLVTVRWRIARSSEWSPDDSPEDPTG
jgi:hypothetical protein